MSEFGNTDIESVLSSIRRLVSDTPKRTEAEAEQEPAPISPLVLTSDQRITEAPVEQTLDALIQDDDDATPGSIFGDSAPAGPTGLEARVAQLEQALDAASADALPGHSAEDGPEVDFPSVETAIDPFTLGADLWGVTPAPAQQEGSVEQALAATIDSTPPVESLEETPAPLLLGTGLEEAARPLPKEDDPVGKDMSPLLLKAGMVSAWQALPEAEDEEPLSAATAAAPDDDVPSLNAESEEADLIEAQVEAAVSEADTLGIVAALPEGNLDQGSFAPAPEAPAVDEAWITAPENAVLDDPSAPFRGTTAEEALVLAVAEDAVDAVAEPDGPLAPLTDSGMIEPEELRAMVSDIVREELRGPLGVKITHNMRKMVRREMLRMMAGNTLK